MSLNFSKQKTNKKIESVQKKFFDLVCGMELDREEVKYTINYAGEKYYFCSKSCQDHFHQFPNKYAFNPNF